MNDLISRKALIGVLEQERSCSSNLRELVFVDAVMSIADNQPIAYDVDKVLEEIEDEIRVIKNNLIVEVSQSMIDKLRTRLSQTEKILQIMKGCGLNEIN